MPTRFGLKKRLKGKNLTSLGINVCENGNIHVINYDVDLEVLFSGNKLIKDIRRVLFTQAPILDKIFVDFFTF